MLAQSPSLDGSGRMRQRRADRRTACRRHAADRRRPRPDLVDRDRELAALHGRVDDLAAGAGGTVLIEGPAGIGKTRLLAEARRLAASDRRAGAVGPRQPAGADLRLRHRAAAVRAVAHRPSAARELLGGAAAGARGVFDGVRRRPVDGSFAVLHGLYWLTINLTAEGPVLLTVDDVQWCDARRCASWPTWSSGSRGCRCCVALTAANRRAAPTTRCWPSSRWNRRTVLRPSALSATAAGCVVRSRLERARTCLRRSLPPDDLGQPAAAAPAAAGAGGRRCPPDVVARGHGACRRVAGRGEPGAAAAAADARRRSSRWRARWRCSGRTRTCPRRRAGPAARGERRRGARPAQPRRDPRRRRVRCGSCTRWCGTRSTGDLPAAERALRHERAARSCGSGARAPSRSPPTCCWRRRAATRDIVAVLRAACRAAADRGASDSAVTYLRRALDEPPTGVTGSSVLLELGTVETLVDGAPAVEHLIEAYDLRPADAGDGPRSRC